MYIHIHIYIYIAPLPGGGRGGGGDGGSQGTAELLREIVLFVATNLASFQVMNYTLLFTTYKSLG